MECGEDFFYVFLMLCLLLTRYTQHEKHFSIMQKIIVSCSWLTLPPSIQPPQSTRAANGLLKLRTAGHCPQTTLQQGKTHAGSQSTVSSLPVCPLPSS